MSQSPHFTTPADGSAADISAGLAPGCYVAQVGGFGTNDFVAVLYATAISAPADEADWFQAVQGAAFWFTAGGGIAATWVKVSPETRRLFGENICVDVAIAKVQTDD